jgi:hypothetical protein
VPLRVVDAMQTNIASAQATAKSFAIPSKPQAPTFTKQLISQTCHMANSILLQAIATDVWSALGSDPNAHFISTSRSLGDHLRRVKNH